MIVLWLCLIPILLAVAARFLLPNTITWRESAIKAGAACAVLALGYGLAAMSMTRDTEILNGAVTSKERNKVSCDHSYRCNCYTSCTTSSNGSQSCTEHCSTCYEHSYDVDWDVLTTLGTINIDRVDRQGLDEPERWTIVKVGDPVSRNNSYTNYLKAAPHSLFNTALAEAETKSYAGLIPDYPEVYDYYHVTHALDVNAGVRNIKDWDHQLDLTLRDLGPGKQVNVLAVFVKGQSRSYKNVLERAWLGGKKNDVIVVFGVNGETIEWVDAFTFGKTDGNHMLAVQLRDRLQALKSTADASAGVAIIRSAVITHFNRVTMEKYKYLAEDAGPSATVIMVIVFVMLLAFGSLLYYFHVTDTGGEPVKAMFNRFTRRF